MAEGDRVTAERDVHIVDMVLAMRLPVRCTGHPFVAEETKFGRAVFPLKMAFVAAVDVIPSAFDRDTDMFVLAAGEMMRMRVFSPFDIQVARRHWTKTFYRPEHFLVCDTRIVLKERREVLKSRNAMRAS